jgi:hypothetical protein
MARMRKTWVLFLLALAAVCPSLMAQAISLRSGAIDTSRPQPAIPEGLRARAAGPREEELVLVQFPGPVSAHQLQALREASVRVYTYLPSYAFLVKMPAGADVEAVASSLGASWSGPFHPAYKIAPEIAAVRAGSSSGARTYQPVMIHVLPEADLGEVMREMKGFGARGVVGTRRGSSFSRIRLLLTPAEIAALREPLAGMRDVFWIELEGRRTLRNDTTVWVGQSGLSGGQTTPIFSQGIYGEGQVVGILDTGIDPDMCWFRDTTLGLPPTNACNGGTVINSAQRKVLGVDFLWSTECAGGIANNEWDTHDHGTHVAGTVAGDNFANPLLHDTADGMAPGAKLVIQDGGFATDNCADLPGIGCPVVDLNPLFQQAYDQGARLHTNSWGDNENAAVQNNYSAGSQDVDEFMWNHKDFLVFFAAGNSGPGTGSVGSPSTAKSAVSVGATLRGTSAESMAGFSSCGPAADGRIKPDVTVPGSNIVSANNDLNVTTNNCGTLSLSGTSMASPGAAGLTALIRQYYTDGWYPTGSEVSTDGFTPSAALLKATLVNSAVSMTGTAAIPANCQGWGRVLLENALSFTGQPRKLFVKDTDSFNTGSSNENRIYNLTVATGEPLKVTLAWTDFPSTPAASVNLNNDLDLIVTGPGGTFLGNVFSGGSSTTGGTADRRNTLEQVLIAAPAAGSYTVTVRSWNVPDGPQPFALVVTGALGSTSCTLNSQCDDGLFCNGAETCNAGSCQAGTDPCAPLSCNEATDTCFVAPTQVTFTSVAADDGYVLEQKETTETGGSSNSTDATTSAVRAGDARQDKQYRSVVSFDTSSIPDGATLQTVTLRLRRGTVAGTSPFGTHGSLSADVRNSGFNGNAALENADFQAAATATAVCTLSNAAANGDWSECTFNAAGLAAVNKTGKTQVRVAFTLDDNDDNGDDSIGYHSGDSATAANRPQLVVTYQ